MGKKQKYVYSFGGGRADGKAEMKNLLGGKGANLAEMSNLKVPVPAGFTMTTEVCTYYYGHRKRYPAELRKQVRDAVARVEKVMCLGYGDPEKPLLVSVRSGARQSMPGMMETVLNVGLTSGTIPGLVRMTGNERFVYDAYRRLITMYSDVVMEKAAGLEPEEGQGIRQQLEGELERVKEARGAKHDTDLSAADMKQVCEKYKQIVKRVIGKEFPDDVEEQLWGGISAVFQSWNGRRAISYRHIEGIPEEWGTAVNVQAMVFGNMGAGSATGVGFTRNPATGEDVFYGEWLPDAQGEDVVAGIRTPMPMNKKAKAPGDTSQSLEEAMPKLYRELAAIRTKLELHYRDMQDIEFTIQEGTLFMLQTRTGKRNGPAAIRMAVEMCRKKLITKEEALMRVRPSQLDELLHPMLDPAAESATKPLATGLPAGPGGATGRIVLTADEAEEAAGKGEQVILVRSETSPEDVHGMHAAEAILTAKGGMTSHAALVARGWGKCCVVGCGALQIDMDSRTVSVDGRELKAGDWISLNGTRGRVYEGKLALRRADPVGDPAYEQLMKWADQVRSLRVRTNADRPEDAEQARKFGAQGIGLTRTEHMFFGEERIMAMRQMILAENVEDRKKALSKLIPFQRRDFSGLLEAMQGLPVTIRLLDPPLHEFLPHEDREVEALAAALGVEAAAIRARVGELKELNPMLGHRGCRLGISYPEITEMQARAIFEATAELTKRKVKVIPEVMVPLVGTVAEFKDQEGIIRSVAAEVMKEQGVRFKYSVGTMIEVPRAALMADQIAEAAEFFSFGTNDLTQMTFGFSRDDVGSFLPGFIERGILPDDPFQTLDQSGVGQLVTMGVAKGRAARPGLKVGICGEHGGDPDSVKFCHRAGMDYVSCSPFRVPIARLAAAQAVLEEKAAAKAARKRKGKGKGAGKKRKSRR